MSGMQLKRLTIPLCDILRTPLSTSFLKSNNIQLENKEKDCGIIRHLRKGIVIRKIPEIKRNLRKRNEEIEYKESSFGDEETEYEESSSENEETEYEESSSGDEETEYEESSSDEEWGNKSVKKKIKSTVTTYSKSATKLSLYEKLIEKNRAEKMAFLETLAMDEAKASLAEIVKEAKKKKPCIRKLKIELSPAVVRKSRRLMLNSNSINFSEDVLYENAIERANKEIEASKKDEAN